MTEQSNDDLIAEARDIWEADDLYPDQMIPRLVKALEAAERRAEAVRAEEREQAAQIAEREAPEMGPHILETAYRRGKAAAASDIAARIREQGKEQGS